MKDVLELQFASWGPIIKYMYMSSVFTRVHKEQAYAVA